IAAMQDDGGGGGAPDGGASTPATRTRAARPAVQIYRPGMMKQGTDITLQARKDDDSSPRDALSSHRRPPRGPGGGGFDRGGRIPNRRRSSPESISGRSNVSSIRDSGSTTPEAGTPTRSGGGGRGGGRKYSGERTFHRGGGNGGGGSSQYGGGYRNGESRESSVRGSTDDVRSTGTYNSTQSLLNPRRQGGYLDYRSERGGGGNRQKRYGGGPGYNNEYGDHDDRRRGGGGNQHYQGGPPNRLPPLMAQPLGRAAPFQRKSGERASLRAEEGNRRQPRRRNDSIGSTQSEMPRGVMNGWSGGGRRSGQKEDPSTQSCAASEVGDYAESSFTDDTSSNWDAQTTVTSFADFCSSYASLAEMDWSKEVEREYIERQEIQNRLAEVAEQDAVDEEENGQEEEGEDGGEGEEEQRYEETVSPRFSNSRVTYDRHDNRSGNQRRGGGGGYGSQERRGYGSQERSKITVRVGANGGRAVGRGGRFADENDDEEDGQRTPTSITARRSSKEEDARAWIQGIGAELATAAGAAPPGGRLAGRVTRDADADASASDAPPRRVDRRPERGSYVPRGMRGSNQSLNTNRYDATSNRVRTNETTGEDTVDSIDPRRSSERETGGMTTQEKKAIKQIEDELRGVLDSLTRKKDVGKARELLLLSSRLAEYHASILTRDVQETYRNHAEASLFRAAYYQPITVLKSCSNSSSVESKECRKMLTRLIKDGIDYYGRVIKSYAEKLGVVLTDRLPWPEAICPSSLEDAIDREAVVRRDETGGLSKYAIGSLSRHLVCLGDLHRYRSTVAGDDDYSAAYKCYLQAGCLLPSSGHTYNQLAILSFYQERVLAELFYLVRAASATHPYESARERMTQRLAAARKKGEKYEQLLDKEHGSLMGGEDALRSTERPREYWIDVVEEGRPGAAVVADKEEESPFADTEITQLHRRTVSYTAYVHALLVCKIGMERFASAASRMFAQLRELLHRPDCPMSAAQLVQCAALSIYAVHAASGSGSASATPTPHSRIAVRVLLTLLGVLLERVRADAPALARAAESGAPPPPAGARVLPALHVLAEWLASSVGAAHYAAAERLRPLELAMVPKAAKGVWEDLAEVANVVEGLEREGALKEAVENDGASDLSSRVVLPESLLLSSFTSAFPSPPKHFSFMDKPESTTVAALHVRLRGILELARFLDGTDACAIVYSMERRRFESTDAFENNNEDEEAREIRRRKSEKDDDRSVSPEPVTDSLRRPIVVCPKFVVIDTNMYVDDLSDVKRILDSGRYQILVPTTVIDELLGLERGRGSVEDQREAAHAVKTVEKAKEALSWLREQTAKKQPKMGTLTLRGQRMAISLANEDADEETAKLVNDDRILEAAAKFTATLPTTASAAAAAAIPAAVAAARPLHRQLALITGDRGMNIKANARSIPVRTIKSFIKWANLP
ncbi:smg-6, partial [Pristionchus pacificus]